MFYSRRRKYYNRCQEIVDDLHRRVANKEFLTTQECIKLYGRSDYQVLLHEFRLLNADTDFKTMTPAMEWLYHSQYFKHKASDENLQTFALICSIISLLVAIVSLFLSAR